MTLQEKQIEVLKWMGWNTEKEILGSVYVYRDDKGNIQATLPQITLDWAHECEKKLEAGFDGSEQDDYQQALYEKANPGRSLINDFTKEGLPDVAYVQNWVCATAEQRLEALYEVIKTSV